MRPGLFGTEDDFEGTSIKERRNYLGIADHLRSRTPWEASVCGRIGYAWDRSLLYVTGSGAFADINERYVAVAATNSRSDHRTNWTLEAG